MTHEERIQHYAQMHADKFKQGIGDEGSDILFIAEAEVTCAAVAEAIRSCKLIPIPFISRQEMEQYLFDNGFIPAKEAGSHDNV